MTVKIGDLGGVRVGSEAVAYGTLAATMIWQHMRAAPLARVSGLLDQPRLSGTKLTTRKYSTGYSEGEFEVAYDDSRAVIGPILAACGALSTDDYVIGDDGTPDEESLSVDRMFGNSAADGYLLQSLGCIPSSLRFAFNPDEPVVLTLGVIGLDDAVGTAATPAPATEAGIVWESDLGTLTIGGTTVCIDSASIDQQFGIVGGNRKCLGTSVIKKPVRTGRVLTTGQFMVELSDDTGADSEAILAAWRAGTALGDIVIGDFTLGNCHMIGDEPAIGSGIVSFPVNVEASELTITTSA